MVPWYTDVIRLAVALSTTMAFAASWWALRHWSHRYIKVVLRVATVTFGVLAAVRWGIVIVNLTGDSTLARVLRRGDVTNVLRIMIDLSWVAALWLGGRRFHRDMMLRRMRRVTTLLDNSEEIVLTDDS